MPLSNPLGLRTLAAAVAMTCLSVVAASAAPPFWGATYARTAGPSDPATLSGGLPVQVSALLPGNLSCMDLVSARLTDRPPYPRVTDSLRAAPVTVTLQPASCPQAGEDRWLNFAVPHPIQADILELVYVTADGRTLASERVSISGGTGGGRGD